MRKVVLLLLILISASAHAHIGSPDIVYEGNAGPYTIHAIIQAPDVVPGIAKVFISFPDCKNRKVKIQPVYYKYGSKGAPPADIAIPVENISGQYQGQLWLMSFGSSSVKISIEGEKGFGATIIPVPAIATATRKMETGIGIVLGFLGLLLFFSFVSIIGASIGEATLKPGMELNSIQKRKIRITMLVIGIFLSTGLVFANKWWNAVEGQYKKNMFKPLTLESKVEQKRNEAKLRLELSNTEWFNRKLSDFVPDHGKLMHLFLVNKSKTIFIHLHPVRQDTSLFYSSLPPIPSGEYQLFADIVHKDGMSETLTDTLQIPNITNSNITDVDDSWTKTIPTGNIQKLDNNLRMVAEFPKTIKAGTIAELKVKLENNKGELITVQPYLGMAGHAVVMKEDGKVFIHLHPMGTISMIAQYALAKQVQEEVSICGVVDSSEAVIYDTLGVADNPVMSLMKNKMRTGTSYNGYISFPYVFPSPGNYKCWVQLKSIGKINTGVFEVVVK